MNHFFLVDGGSLARSAAWDAFQISDKTSSMIWRCGRKCNHRLLVGDVVVLASVYACSNSSVLLARGSLLYLWVNSLNKCLRL